MLFVSELSVTIERIASNKSRCYGLFILIARWDTAVDSRPPTVDASPAS